MKQTTISPQPHPVTVIAFVTIAEDQPMALAVYLQVTAELLERAGAKFTKRFNVSELGMGSRAAQSVLIVEYPNRAAVDMVFDSPEYQALIPVRDLAFVTHQVSIVAG